MGYSIKEYVFRKGALQGIPVSGTFELTNRCNLNCKMCYIHEDSEKSVVQKAEDQQKTENCAGSACAGSACAGSTVLPSAFWVGLGRQAADAGMVYLLLTGGEPLMHPDFVNIYENLIRLGLRISLNTNGTLISHEIVNLFRRYPPEQVNVTIYGSSEETYRNVCGVGAGFRLARKGVKRLKDAGIRVNINTTFIKENRSDMQDIITWAKREELPVRTASYLFPPVRKEALKLKELPEQEERTALVSANSSYKEIYLSPGEQGALCAEFERLTSSEDMQKKTRKSELARQILEDIDGPEEKAGRRCLAGRGTFWITWDGRMLPCGMLENMSVRMNVREDAVGEDLAGQEIFLDFKETWNRIREKSENIEVPAQCEMCQARKVCPVCCAVWESLGKSRELLKQQMCARTYAYVKELAQERI